MPDEANADLVPWVSTGIDRTTQHHLRLPIEFLDGLPGVEDGASASVEGELLQTLRPYFSSREFALVRRIKVTPFVAGDRLVAALLLVDSENSPLARTVDLSELESAAPLAARKIEGARAILGQGPAEMRLAALRSHVLSILGEAQGAGLHVTIARINLDRLAGELLSKSSTQADLYRFKRDLAGALTTMVSGSGELVGSSAGRMLLIIQSKTPYSERLLGHQLTQGVKTLLAAPPVLNELTEQMWRFPSDGESVDEVIDTILR